MKRLLPMVLCLPFYGLTAQTTDHYIISAQGNETKGQTMSLCWTIGDLATETSGIDQALTTQGFQQPTLFVKELDPASQPHPLIDEAGKPVNALPLKGDAEAQASNSAIKANVYPNPFSNDITVEVGNITQEYHLDVFDPQGNLISRCTSGNAKEIIRLEDLPAAQYILRISTLDDMHTQVFQIVKSK
ncbi:MAG: T9SS type A sorting domain-containing protein [Saprospiraceae bacterium]|nr:T9SS type A sorting domain-containing protein [Candidatus Opimibacter skivensis]MBL0007987.1 T9SS type A sorting domain-containing protein [Candidatus Opimibacter skivensis]MBP6679578.1 T9SS type A sorting domain-containing protein [Saprospiraceae bacterium]MBP8085812.1 T9SS type A sorting domain-containing protein [Saprospiraceae bacterium]